MGFTIAELKSQLKARGVKGYSGLKKAELEAMMAKLAPASKPAPLSASGSARRVKMISGKNIAESDKFYDEQRYKNKFHKELGTTAKLFKKGTYATHSALKDGEFLLFRKDLPPIPLKYVNRYLDIKHEEVVGAMPPKEYYFNPLDDAATKKKGLTVTKKDDDWIKKAIVRNAGNEWEKIYIKVLNTPPLIKKLNPHLGVYHTHKEGEKGTQTGVLYAEWYSYNNKGTSMTYHLRKAGWFNRDARLRIVD
jgi:hypothetical protein